MPRLKKTITIEVPQSAMAIFEHLVAEEGYELIPNPMSVSVIADELYDDDLEEAGEDEPDDDEDEPDDIDDDEEDSG